MKSSQTTDFNFEVSVSVCGTGVMRRARAITDVMAGLERACLMSSVATYPVEPAMMSSMIL